MKLFCYNLSFRSPVVVSKIPTSVYRLNIWYKGNNWVEQFKRMTEKDARQLLLTQSDRFKNWDSYKSDSVELQKLNEETMSWEFVSCVDFDVSVQLVSYIVES